MSDVKNHLIFAILRYFEDELLNSDLTPDAKESLEVASQCLENVYKLNSSDAQNKAKYQLPASLPDIFMAGLTIKKEETKAKEIPPEQKEQADKFKSEGNNKMKQEKFEEAVDCYTSAIDLDNTNAVYFCNRAAAYSKLNKHVEALGDCEKALLIDSNYSKAFGRKGLAHSSLNQNTEAHQAFERAVELDPGNESYKKNLEVAEQKLAEQATTGDGATAGFPGGLNLGGMGGMGGMDFASMMNNPALMNMATQMMSNPQMQDMMSNLMSSFQGGGGAGGPDLSGLLQAGQQMAQQVQQSNPELIEQLRSGMGGDDTSSQKEDSDQSKGPNGDGTAS